MYDYILFDLDGTLTDPKEGITRCVAYALEHFGIHEDNLDALTNFIGPPLVDSFQEFYGFDEEKALEAVAKYRERFAPIGVFENRVYPGIDSMLKALTDAGKILALATSKPWVFAEKILEKYELAPYFKVVVGAELDGRRNAKSEVIAEALSQLGITNETLSRCIMVGDRRQDINGAKANAIDSLGVRIGYAEPGELEAAGATYIADTVEEMRKMLLSL